MLAGMLISLAVSTGPEHNHFLLIDLSRPNMSWSDTLHHVCEDVLRPAGFTPALVKQRRAACKALEKMETILDERKFMDEEQKATRPSFFVFIAEADHFDELVPAGIRYDVEDSLTGSILYRLYNEGPPLGIHLIASFSAVAILLSILVKDRITYFRHRIGMQMSEDDSFKFVRGRNASRLQEVNSKPIAALYTDVINNRETRFKPYSLDATIDFTMQLRDIGTTLKTWRNIP